LATTKLQEKVKKKEDEKAKQLQVKAWRSKLVGVN
jgi:hypothetical protein